MELRPAARYRQPRYPTHRILDEHPELLRLLPARWRRDTLALAAPIFGHIPGAHHRPQARTLGPALPIPVLYHRWFKQLRATPPPTF
jgi:hypothetical protein